jgi:hypothetical protein
LNNKKFERFEEVNDAILAYFESKPTSFYKAGIEKLVTRWEMVIASNGNYIIIKYCKYIKKMIDFSFEKRKNFPFNPIVKWILGK